MRHEIFDLLKRAEAGTCTFGSAKNGNNIDQMTVAPTILELRLGYCPGEDGERHLVRLYFTEPEEIPECLYAAKLASKHPGPMGLQEQSQHAKEAEARVEQALGRGSKG